MVQQSVFRNNVFSDIVENGEIKEKDIHNKLKKKAGLNFELYSIKKNLPIHWLTARNKSNYTQIGVNEILNSKFYVPMTGIKKLIDLTSGDMYKIFMFTELTACKATTYWTKKIPDINIDFDKWYLCNFMNKLTPRKCLDFNWRIFHGHRK